MSIRLVDGSEFLHLPKTGGTWVTSVLEQHKLIAKHVAHTHSDHDLSLFAERMGTGHELLRISLKLAACKLKRKLGLSASDPEHRPRFRFCFVRHPLAWYESWWKYMQRLQWYDSWGKQHSLRHWHPALALKGLGDDNFNCFVSNVVRIRPGYVSELYFSFAKPGISFIGKTEHLVDDLIYVLQRLGFSIDPDAIRATEKVNVSPAPDSQVQWDPGLKRTVMRLELPALTHFDYLTDEETKGLGLSINIPPHAALRRRPAKAA